MLLITQFSVLIHLANLHTVIPTTVTEHYVLSCPQPPIPTKEAPQDLSPSTTTDKEVSDTKEEGKETKTTDTPPAPVEEKKGEEESTEGTPGGTTKQGSEVKDEKPGSVTLSPGEKMEEEEKGREKENDKESEEAPVATEASDNKEKMDRQQPSDMMKGE